MSKLIGHFRVRPLYGQVSVESESPSSTPIPETGEEPVVALPESILIATRSDHEGDVDLELYAGAAPLEGFSKVYSGAINLRTPFVVLGNTIGNQIWKVRVPAAGQMPVEIYVDRPSSASRVRISLPSVPPRS